MSSFPIVGSVIERQALRWEASWANSQDNDERIASLYLCEARSRGACDLGSDLNRAMHGNLDPIEDKKQNWLCGEGGMSGFLGGLQSGCQNTLRFGGDVARGLGNGPRALAAGVQSFVGDPIGVIQDINTAAQRLSNSCDGKWTDCVDVAADTFVDPALAPVTDTVRCLQGDTGQPVGECIGEGLFTATVALGTTAIGGGIASRAARHLDAAPAPRRLERPATSAARGVDDVPTALTNGRQFETLSSQPVSGVSRSGHRAAANRQLVGQLEADPALRQFYDDALGTDVVGHMRGGSSGLRNPPGTQWHHPTWDPDSVLLLRQEVHRHPDLQGILHPGPRGGGGYAQHYGGG